MKATEIIKNLINLVGVTAGIIITSIGAIMLINSFLKVYIFGIEKSSYDDPKWECTKYDLEQKKVDNIFIVDEKIKKEFSESEKKELSDKYSKCLVEENLKLKEKYFASKKEDMADGLAFLIVGLPILLFYQRRRVRE